MARIGSLFRAASFASTSSHKQTEESTSKADNVNPSQKDVVEEPEEFDSGDEFDTPIDSPAPPSDELSSAPLPSVDISKSNLKALAPVAAENLAADLKQSQTALTHFLNSQFTAADQVLRPSYGTSLYHTLGLAVIRTIKAGMTFEPADIAQAIEAINITVEMAQAWRKKEAGMVASLAGSVVGLVWSSGGSSSSTDKSKRPDPTGLRSMTNLQRHAEIVFAEAFLMKAMLSLLTDTNMIAFVREGMNIRNAYNVYKTCYKFLETELEEVGPEGLRAEGVDEHFASGVLLGIGAFNMVFSMVPPRVLRVFEMIGFSGDRAFGLSRLQLGGGWSGTEGIEDPPASQSTKPKKKGNKAATVPQRSTETDAAWAAFLSPPSSPDAEDSPTPPGGLRKPLCNLVLLTYHIILSSQIQLPDCNLPFSHRVLHSELLHHPDSFIFLTYQGRLLQTQRDPLSAISQYKRVMAMQKEWKQLSHVCLWDMGLCYLALGMFGEAAGCYEVLRRESRWSRSMYAYLLGVSLYCQDREGNMERVVELFEDVPKLRRKVAGRSIPIEKFIARKTRKFTLQQNRLLLPHLEILYIFNGLDIIPPDVIPTHLTAINEHISSLDLQMQQARKASPKDDDDALSITPYETYNDDYCLAHFLKGIILRELNLPKCETLVPVRTLVTQQKHHRSTTEWTEKTKPALQTALQHLRIVSSRGPEITLDHWILPFARLEMGQTLMRMGEYEGAKREFDAALKGGVGSGGGDEDGEGVVGSVKERGKGKISMENALHVRVHNARSKLGVLVEVEEEGGE
ncbi:hypothetical protein HDV00_003373 [Rhizophlyctis rosea]|nr:hypothetical protein HDV00_003373 [Rhizophlyctis rosea]